MQTIMYGFYPSKFWDKIPWSSILRINKWIHQEFENIYSSVVPKVTETVVSLDQFEAKIVDHPNIIC